MIQRPLFLITDYGLTDNFVGLMKAQIMKYGFEGTIIDLSHHVAARHILQAALMIEDALPWIPENSVVCAVIDPGVGSSRKAMCLQARDRFFVGPDNGTFTPIFSDETVVAREIDEEKHLMAQPSKTFHGRDIFAPLAALLASGKLLFHQVGTEITDPVSLEIPEVKFSENSLEIPILTADTFGNLATALKGSQAKQYPLRKGTFTFRGEALPPMQDTFSAAPIGEPVVYFNSFGRLELAINQGSAAKVFEPKDGETIHWRLD